MSENNQSKKEYKVRTHTPVEGDTIEELRAKPINKLAEIAKSLGIENPQEFLRQDIGQSLDCFEARY